MRCGLGILNMSAEQARWVQQNATSLVPLWSVDRRPIFGTRTICRLAPTTEMPSEVQDSMQNVEDHVVVRMNVGASDAGQGLLVQGVKASDLAKCTPL